MRTDILSIYSEINLREMPSGSEENIGSGQGMRVVRQRGSVWKLTLIVMPTLLLLVVV